MISAGIPFAVYQISNCKEIYQGLINLYLPQMGPLWSFLKPMNSYVLIFQHHKLYIPIQRVNTLLGSINSNRDQDKRGNEDNLKTIFLISQ